MQSFIVVTILTSSVLQKLFEKLIFNLLEYQTCAFWQFSTKRPRFKKKELVILEA